MNRKVAKVPGKSRGPSIMLRVMAGDTIEISAKAFYNIDNTLPGKGVNIAPIVGSAIAAMTSPVGAVLDEAAQLALDLGAEASQSVALVGLPKEDKDEYQNPQPKSGINFVAYNEKFKLVPENTGVLMVEDNIHTIQTLATDRIIIRESGFLEVYAHNEAQTPVYFDNMTVSRRAGAALEVNAYYPYGMLNPGLSSSNGAAPNAYKYNAKELQKELNLNWLDYGARMYAWDYNRWPTPDPLAENHYNMSPYAFSGNNPVNNIDPDGLDWVHRVVDGVDEYYYDRSVTSQEDVNNKYGKKSGVTYMASGTSVTKYNEDGSIKSQYTFTNDTKENKYGTVTDANGNVMDKSQIVYGSDYTIFGTSDNSVNAETLHKNLFGTSYTGAKNPKDYNNEDSYQYQPRNVSEYPTITHDQLYDAFGAKGPLDVFTNINVWGPDILLGLQSRDISSNPNVSFKERRRAAAAGMFFQIVGSIKTGLYFNKQTNEYIHKKIWNKK